MAAELLKDGGFLRIDRGQFWQFFLLQPMVVVRRKNIFTAALIRGRRNVMLALVCPEPDQTWDDVDLGLIVGCVDRLNRAPIIRPEKKHWNGIFLTPQSIRLLSPERLADFAGFQVTLDQIHGQKYCFLHPLEELPADEPEDLRIIYTLANGVLPDWREQACGHSAAHEILFLECMAESSLIGVVYQGCRSPFHELRLSPAGMMTLSSGQDSAVISSIN